MFALQERTWLAGDRPITVAASPVMPLSRSWRYAEAQHRPSSHAWLPRAVRENALVEETRIFNQIGR